MSVVGADRCIFGTERPGSASATDPETDRPFDDIKRLLEEITFLDDESRRAIFTENPLTVFPRAAKLLD